MIPFPVAPLSGLTVLVTRPTEQAESLCQRIETLGGHSIRFPTITIESLDGVPPHGPYDWVVFVSVNAVRHGLSRLQLGATTRIAAIGKATAAALAAAGLRVDVVPAATSTSETLLAEPAFATLARQRILIVKGAGGRDLLPETFRQRGATVESFDVYRRVRAMHDPSAVLQLEASWREYGVDIVTLTSVETLDNLLQVLTDAGRELLRYTPFVAASERIASIALTRGLAGGAVLARGADDDALLGAIAAWHARAR